MLNKSYKELRYQGLELQIHDKTLSTKPYMVDYEKYLKGNNLQNCLNASMNSLQVFVFLCLSIGSSGKNKHKVMFWKWINLEIKQENITINFNK